MNYERQVKALNKRLVTTDSKKAGAVKGNGLAVDVRVAVMFEDRGTME